MKVKGNIVTEEFKNTKSVQEDNIRELLQTMNRGNVIVFTDGSALSNPGPTGAGAVVYLEGYQSSPVLLKKGVSPVGNNFTGELVGIQIAVEFLAAYDGNDAVHGRNIHIFTDCQAAITANHTYKQNRNHLDLNLLLDVKTDDLYKQWRTNILCELETFLAVPNVPDTLASIFSRCKRIYTF